MFLPWKTLLISTLTLLAHSHYAYCEVTNSEGSTPLSTAAPLLTTTDILHNSPTCQVSAQPSQQQDRAKQRMLDSINSQKLLTSFSYFQTQAMNLRVLGGTRIFESPATKDSLSKVFSSCASSRPGTNFNRSMLNLKETLLSPPPALTSEAKVMQKKYLMAMYEYKRIQLILDDNPGIDRNEKLNLKTRLVNILKHYPLANSSYLYPGELGIYIQKFGPIYDRYSTRTYAHIDRFLFSENEPLSSLPVGPTRSTGELLANKLISEDLPEHISKNLVRSLELSLKKPLDAVAGLCSLNPCEQMDLDHTALTDYVNSQSESQKAKLMSHVCHCKLNSDQRLVSGKITTPLGVAALASGALCLMGAGPFCIGALITGGSATALEAANVVHSLNKMGETSALKSILTNMPQSSLAEIERLNQRNERHLKTLMIDASIGLGAGATTKLALGQLAKLYRRVRNQRYRDFSPDSHIVNQWGDRSVHKEVLPNGQVQYSMTSGQRTMQLRTDVSGYAVAANNEQGRQIAREIISSGDQSVIFVDVNNLGKINYFQGGMKAGDDYLSAVAKEVSEKVGDLGTVFRWGGDEFVVSLNTTNRDLIREVQTRIRDGVAESATARAVFTAERRSRRQMYQTVQRASNFGELPASFRSSLTPDEATFARSNFTAFLARHKEVEHQAFYDSAALQPSVSIGSSIVGQRSADEALTAAEKVAEASKIEYKSSLGQDVCKYIGRATYLPVGSVCPTTRDLRTLPPILDTN